MGYASSATLKHYVGYRGFELTETAIDRTEGLRDATRLQGTLSRRPVNTDQLVGGSMAGASRPRQPSRGARFGTQFGIELSADTLGGFKPQAYGGISSCVLVVDPGHDPPMGFLIAGRVGVSHAKPDDAKSLAVEAFERVVGEYELHGHHQPKWGEPIIALRTDMGSGFISQEMADRCQGFRVRQQWSTPDCHQQNGVAEAYVRDLFSVVTSCYAAAPWVPRHLWMYALKYVVFCKNLAVADGGMSCPFEAFYGKKFNFRSRPLMPWGCPLLLFVPKHLRTWKFGERGIPAMYLGTPEGVKEGIYVFVPLTKRVRIAREYAILESFPRDWPVYKGESYAHVPTMDAGASHMPDHDRLLEDDLEFLLENGGELQSTSAEMPTERSGIQEVQRVDPETSLPLPMVERPVGSIVPLPEEVSVPESLAGAQLVPASHTSAAGDDAFLSTVADGPESSCWDDEEPTPVVRSSSEAGAGAALGSTTPVVSSNQQPVPPPPQKAFAPAPLEARAVEQPEAMGAGLTPEQEVLATVPVAGDGSDESRSNGAGGGTKLVFGTSLGPLDPKCPDLQYVFVGAVCSRCDKVCGRRRVYKNLDRARRQMAEEALLKRTQRASDRRWRFRAAKQARKQAKKRSPDNPSVAMALKGPLREQVLEAMDLELAAYIEVFEAIRLLDQEELNCMSREQLRDAITSHFEIEYKRDPFTWEVVRVKARLCIHGNQTSKYLYDDIKSPTARPAAVKMLFAMMAKTTPDGRRFTGRTWDVSSAFLQNNIAQRSAAKRSRRPFCVDGGTKPQRILLRLPDGRIGELLVYAYGLKQASYEWYSWVADVLVANGFVRTADPCIFKMWDGKDVIILSIHVDDFFAISTCDRLHDRLDAVLDEEFTFDKEKPLKRGIGPQLSYLKMRIQHLPDGSVQVDQAQYLASVISAWGHGQGPSTKPAWRLIDDAEVGVVDHPLQASYTPQPGDDDPVDPTWFKGVIGAVNYAASMTRPDLLYPMSVLAEASNSPTGLHRRMLKRIMKYLVGTAEVGLTYCSDSDWDLVGWADASFATRDGSKSQTGYCFALGQQNASFYARSQKQNLVTLSSTEAEYVALFHAATEVVYLRRLLKSMGFEQRDPTLIYQDNQSTILWANGQRQHQRTKHINVKYHYIQELVQNEVVELEYLPTTDMVADVLTKSLLAERFQAPARKLMGNMYI